MRNEPTAEEMALDIEAHLRSLERYGDDIGGLYSGWVCLGHHRAAIRRALAAEARVQALEAQLRMCDGGMADGDV